MGLWLGPGLAALERCWPCVEQWGFRAPGETFAVRWAGGCPVHVAVPVNVPCQGGLPCCQQHLPGLFKYREKTRLLVAGRASRGHPFPPPAPQGHQQQCRDVCPGRFPRRAPRLRSRSAVFWACGFYPGHLSVCGPRPLRWHGVLRGSSGTSASERLLRCADLGLLCRFLETWLQMERLC